MASWTLLLLAVSWPFSSGMKILAGGDACERNSFNPFNLCCGLNVFNAKKSFCCGGVSVDIPCLGIRPTCGIQAPAYDIFTQVCLFGEEVRVAAYCCPGGIKYFCCGGVIRNLPLNECGLADDHPDDFCCGDYRISANFVSCCAEKIPYNPRKEYCCGTFVVPAEGYNMESSSYPDSTPEMMNMEKQKCIGGIVIPRNSSADDKIGYCCGIEIRPKVTTPTTTPKPLPMCGSMSYDDTKTMCCGGYPYPSNVYMCCGGQVQGKPQDGACCGRYAFSRLSHRCIRGVIYRL